MWKQIVARYRRCIYTWTMHHQLNNVMQNLSFKIVKRRLFVCLFVYSFWYLKSKIPKQSQQELGFSHGKKRMDKKKMFSSSFHPGEIVMSVNKIKKRKDTHTHTMGWVGRRYMHIRVSTPQSSRIFVVKYLCSTWGVDVTSRYVVGSREEIFDRKTGSWLRDVLTYQDRLKILDKKDTQPNLLEQKTPLSSLLPSGRSCSSATYKIMAGGLRTFSLQTV